MACSLLFTRFRVGVEHAELAFPIYLVKRRPYRTADKDCDDKYGDRNELLLSTFSTLLMGRIQFVTIGNPLFAG